MVGFLWRDGVLPSGRRLGVVSRVERRALLAERVAWTGSLASAVGLALLVSTSIKVWLIGNAFGVVAGAIGVLLAAGLLRRAHPADTA